MFTAVFKKFGLRSEYRSPIKLMAYLKDVKDETGNIMFDEVCLELPINFDKNSLKENDNVKFEKKNKTITSIEKEI